MVKITRDVVINSHQSALVRASIVLLAVCLFATGGQALMVPMDDADLATGADEIVRGTITNVRSQWNADHTNIVTTATVTVRGYAKGQGPNMFTLTVPGGTADGITQWVEDQPILTAGTDAFIFVKHSAKRGNTVLGGHQGLVTIVLGGVIQGPKGKDSTVRADVYERYLTALGAGQSPTPPQPNATTRVVGAAPVIITSVSPTTASAGTETIITITGSGFGTKASRESLADVAFTYRCRNADGGAIQVIPIYASGYCSSSSPYFGNNVNDIVSWSDTQIRVKVPIGRTLDAYSGGASSGYLTVYTDADGKSEDHPFTVTFSYGKSKWNGPAQFYVNPGTLGPGAVTAITNAANTWNAAIPTSSFLFQNLGTSSSTEFSEDQRDFRNLLCFRPASDFDSTSTIAEAITWSIGNRIVETDIRFNLAFSWTTGTASGSTQNVETIALHELGHWLHLNDLYGYLPNRPSDVGKVMFGYNGDTFGNKNLKTLHTADRAGAQWIYGGSTPTPTLTVSSISPNSGMPDSSISITSLSGTGFQSGATVKLQRAGSIDITATAVSVATPSLITCQFAIPSSTSTGAWNVLVTNPDGQSATLPSGFSVTAPQALTAAFIAAPTSGTAPLAVQFTDTSTGSPASWSWNFGDGGTSTLQNPSHTYTTAGTYTVSLTARNAAGTSDIETKTGFIQVTTAPVTGRLVAEFSAVPTQAASAPADVQFTDLSTGNPNRWVWFFGDGTSSTLQHPVHRYAQAGTFSVTLYLFNVTSFASTTKTGYIQIGGSAPLAAGFTAEPTSGQAPLAVQFTDTTTGSPTSWSWNFGDGTAVSTTEHPSHTYTTPGTYSVSLTVRNSAGQSNTKTMPGMITVVGSTATAPWYVPHVLPATVQAEDYDTNGAGNAYMDTTAANEGGAYRTDAVDIERLSTGAHVVCYIREGEWTRYTVDSPTAATYPVSFRVSRWLDPLRTIEVYVDSTRQVTLAVSKTASSSIFSTVSTSLAIPAGRHTITLKYHGGSMNFDSFVVGTSSSVPGSPLGDAVDAPTLAWNTDGTAQWTSQQAVTHDGVDAAQSGNVGNSQRSRLSTQVTGPATVTWWWRVSSEGDFDFLNLVVDGQIRRGISGEAGWQQASTTVGAGSHTLVWDYVKDGSNDDGSDCGWVDQVETSGPTDTRVAEFGALKTSGRAPFVAQFTDCSTGSPIAWSWTFGDGGTSTAPNPTHTYTTNGYLYTVTLKVTYSGGITRAMTKNYFIHVSEYY